MVFWVGIGYTLIKFTGKIKLVYEVDLVCDHLWYTKTLLVTNWEPPELSLYTFKPVCRTTLETYWGKLQNLLGMKVTTDVTWQFFSAVNNGLFAVVFCHRWGLSN